jgi:hypothetical protein
VVVFFAVAIFVTVMAPRAGAVSDAEELGRFGSEGTAAGQLERPGGIATDPVTGQVYVSESGSSRISEFTPWGEFVKAFGWDVAPGMVNEQQEVRVTAAAGQFKLSFGASTTPDLAFDAPGTVSEGTGSVEAALNGLASIGTGGVSVRRVAGALDGSTPIIYVVSFNGAPFAGIDVPQLGSESGTTPLSGGVSSSGVMVRTRVDGHATGAGLESCTAESGCQAGLRGAGAGESHEVIGIAVDTNGNVYVMDFANHRVQKFDSAGRFVLMFGGEVDKTTHANVCTAVSGDECGIGTTGTGNGQFNAEGGGGIALCPTSALCPSGALFVNDHDRIQRFSLGGEYESQLPVGSGNLQKLAFDPVSNDLYATFGEKADVHKLSSTTGEEIPPSLTVNGAGPLATDSAGDVFARSGGIAQLVLEYGADGKLLSPASCCEAEHLDIGALATNAAGDLYVAYSVSSVDSFIRSFGPGPAMFEGPPKVPPTIESEYALSADQDSAVVRAQINPHFWSDTAYYVQYGTGDCAVSTCVSQPAAPGSRLTDRVAAAPLASGDVLLSGLQPDTTYHYRFVSESGGGGPVFGPDHTFSTFPEPGLNTDCPNHVFRAGFSALLSDCRAYEMVSPVDKGNSDVVTVPGSSDVRNGLDESSIDGGRLTYSSYRSFGEARGAPYTSQYIAGRDSASGWSTEAISPTQVVGPGSDGSHFQTNYKLFSADLSSAWLAPAAVEPVLAPGAVEGFHTLYRRDNESGGFEALNTVAPLNVSSTEFEPELQGVSADGSRMVFRTRGELTSNASSATGGGGAPIHQLYESVRGGSLHLVSVLPDGTTNAKESTAGSLDSTYNPYDLQSSVSHAVSADGSRIYWSETDEVANVEVGKIYLRENADREQSALSEGECVEPDKACTVTVSNKVAQFWTASTDGSKALYTVIEGAHAGELDEFNLEEVLSIPIAGKVQGVLGASEDLSYVYFVSSEALASGAQAGQPNLYVRHEGATSFIATLSVRDGSDTATQPVRHAARVTPDGRHVAFISAASLTGYDNIDAVTGEPDSEVYTYDAESRTLSCVSCDRSGARPNGRNVSPVTGEPSVRAAGSIPVWENELYAPRALSDDGNRLFFNSYDALVPRDTNGKEDVYEWEMAGSGDCVVQSPAFSPANGGCVSLISSGGNPQDSAFVDASPSGNDVFFATAASLSPQDPGLVDIYDARVDGGFPAPAAPPASCEGEACQGALVPPNDSTPASAVFSGPGDLVSALVTGTKTSAQSRKTAAQVRSANLARALRACRKKAKSKRVKSCEAAARKRYGVSAKSNARKSTKGRSK